MSRLVAGRVSTHPNELTFGSYFTTGEDDCIHAKKFGDVGRDIRQMLDLYARYLKVLWDRLIPIAK